MTPIYIQHFEITDYKRQDKIKGNHPSCSFNFGFYLLEWSLEILP